MDNEIWKPIIGIDFCEVSDQGNVRTLPHNHPSQKRFYTGGIRKITKLPNGYCVVTLYNINKSVHKLVAQAFPEICGEWFEGCEVHHINHNPQDNRATNLVVLSKDEHQKYHQESTITKEKKNIQNRYSKTVAQYDYNYNLIQIFNSTIDAANAINGDVASLRSAAGDKPKNGTHFYKGYRWLYL